jgi:hypothetical protein
MAKRRNSFKLTSVVRVDIYWQNNPELMKAYHQFERENDIFPAVRGGSSGPESFCYYYTGQDAQKIRKFLLKQKANQLK